MTSKVNLADLIPVLNRDLRVYRISRYMTAPAPTAPGALPQTCPVDTHRLTPGLGWVKPESVLDVQALAESTGGAVSVIDLKSLSKRDRTELIDLTVDPMALRIYKEFAKSNAEIRAQINTRLREMGTQVHN